ncbi:Phosphate transporter PHO1 -like protein 10 [Babesia sp. Xinjiang]|uniref:Phosphate transporter PHO1 -like protein 10 n=1 Tax=Babesia sp. Xinjiang TaxID=462227 RepID=UPI000A2219C1|nr:Phosphate transporter PHO1 -like protein 10 [Babesia sp. Xinjiang]XP_028871470.1 Phosphate transporter PHO1 -like protein 10 [Babesia sp. Xinjiang]ORM40903.1 Phosphate transporter PHO1 -like protein 10 [Babesia sp. Xinjiang]ORM41014.1 Phosphate transporter PHO1 -like protein 10 [Babesia sp. Xinjiang]
MKFGAKLQTFIVPEWSDKYIRYKELSRLAKRASRINSGKIPGVDDDTERDMLQKLFNVECHTSYQRSTTLSGRSRSECRSEPNDITPIHRPSSSANFHTSEQIVVSIPEEDGSGSASNTDDGERRKQRTSHLPPLPKDVSDHSGAVKDVVNHYEKHGHVSSPNLEPSSEALTYLHVQLQKLGRVPYSCTVDTDNLVPSSDGQDDSINSVDGVSTGPSEGPIVQKSGKHGVSLGDTQPEFDRINVLDILKDNASSRKSVSRDVWCCSMGCSFCSASKGATSRFNLRKNTNVMDDESLSVFNKVLRDDIRVVMIHYVTELDYIKSLVRFLKADIARRGGKLDDSYAGLIRKACTAFWDSCDKLKLYLNLNTLAVFKVLKKKDKLLSTSDVFNLFPMYKSIMLSVETSQGVLEDVIQIYNLLMDNPVVDFGVLKTDIETTLDSLRSKPAHGLFFVYGLCTVLLVNSLFFCSFSFPLPFDLNILLSQIATFRFFFTMSVLWWGFGWCQNYLETYGVNYQFQFGLSSNYSATDKDYYQLGAGQTFSCLLLFVLFLLDCRLHIVPPHHLYFLYPITLVALHLIIVMWPNRNLKLKLRKRLLFAIFRVLGAPFGAGEKITLGDSIIADVMTSLTRPLRDMVFMITYFLFGMTSDHKIPSPVIQAWIVPAVMCYPYIIRFSQCFRRYIKEKRWLHVGNMAKYLSGILCVVVSSIDWVYIFGMQEWQRHFLVVSFYVFATLFQCWWDYVIDWGLDLNWNIFKRRQNRHMYRREAYFCAVFFNMLCRCTWAFTTIPFSLLKNEELSLDIVSLIVSVIEIVRRVVWVTFRLESEHLLNSYKYRTALWVPKLYNCKNLIVKEMKMLNEQL